MSIRKIRIGVIGGASIAKRLVIPALLELTDHFELVAIASRTAEHAGELAQQFGARPVTGYDALVHDQDIEAVYLPLPTGLHEEWMIKCLAAGKHILAEKSLATDAGSAARIIDAARKHKRVVMENFMFKYHSQHQWIWKMIHEGGLGEFRLFRSQFGFPPLDRSNFRYNKALGGGSLLDAGAYTIKAASWFLGNATRLQSAVLYFDQQSGVDLYGNASLVNEKGQVAQLSFGFDNYYQCNYEFWFSKARLLAERAFTPKPGERPPVLLERQGKKENISLEADNHFINILLAFHSAVADNEHERFLDEIILQSKLLTQIQQEAIRITL